MTAHTLRNLLLAIAIATLLVACGGSTSGGDDDDGGSSDGGGNAGGGDDTDTPTLAAQIGSLDNNGEFQNGQIRVSDPDLEAGQSTNLTVHVRDGDGNNLSESVAVFFSSPCTVNGEADIAPAVVNTESGVATTNYTALGCEGNDTVTARTSVNDTTLMAMADIETSLAESVAINFSSVSTPLLGLRGTDALPEQATVSFTVTNPSGAPVPGQRVDFELNTKVGDLGLSNDSTTTDSNGVATTTVASGTVATPVRVTATTTGASGQEQSAQSSELAVTTGLPDNDSFSLSATTLNVEGLEFDGVVVDVTIRAADRFNNPVPDGTAVTFTTEGGSIPGSCRTEDGACTVTFTTQNPRPADGRATILATAIGEESFSDTNPSNGRYDDGEFDLDNDLPEAFVDYNENGTRESNEPYTDFDGDNDYDLGDDEFTGIQCEPRGSSLACETNSLNVRDQVVIVFSASSQTIEFQPPAVDLSDGNVVVDVLIAGSNGQIPPADTEISASTTLGSIVGPSEYTVLSSSLQGPYIARFELEPEAGVTNAQTGRLNVTVTTPRDIISRNFATVSQDPPASPSQ